RSPVDGVGPGVHRHTAAQDGAIEMFELGGSLGDLCLDDGRQLSVRPVVEFKRSLHAVPSISTLGMVGTDVKEGRTSRLLLMVHKKTLSSLEGACWVARLPLSYVGSGPD